MVGNGGPFSIFVKETAAFIFQFRKNWNSSKWLPGTMRFFGIILFCFICFSSYSDSLDGDRACIKERVAENELIELNKIQLNVQGPNPILKLLRQKQKNNRKITAALLAFPFPFGIVGLHRIYLGTKPYVPIAYIATLGGVFGIIPLVDFFVILLDKDFEHLENNGKVLMWVK